jgi:SAM-dependent methyltransferase
MIEQWNNDSVRVLERSSIRAFMEHNRQYLRGRVLDFGAGKQPYRDLVQGEYVPIVQGDRWPAGDFDCVMCNQVMQYLDRPLDFLRCFHGWLLSRQGWLVMTYPTNWDEVEDTDFWRFTKRGMEVLLLQAAEFEIISHERRAEVNLNGFKFPLGYGLVARAR